MLGRGRMLFRVHPRGADSLLVLSLRLDLREANFVARQVAKAARSVNRSANIGLAFSMALHTREEAERREHPNNGVASANANAPALHKPPIDLPRLAPLLSRPPSPWPVPLPPMIWTCWQDSCATRHS